MPDLTDDDYDALYAAVQAHMPRITRSIFPNVLAQLVREGVLTLSVTDFEVTVWMPGVPDTGRFRVERKPRLH